MLRRLVVILLGVLLLMGCGAPQKPAETVIPTATATRQYVIPTTPVKPGLMSCSVVAAPTPQVSPTPFFPAVRPQDWLAGAPDAPVTLLVYNDFNCFSCADFARSYRRLQQAYPDEVRLIYRFHPTDYLDKSLIAAQAAQAAGLQGRFWELHDLLYAQQAAWLPLTVAEFSGWVTGQAEALGCDGAQFAADLNSEAVLQRVQADMADVTRLKIPVAPFLAINDHTYAGPSDPNSLAMIVNLHLLARRQYTRCPPIVIDPQREYIATLRTTKGDIVIQLYADKAPSAVNSFVFLARAGWYDGVQFHQVIPGSYALTGDPSGTGLGNPGYTFYEQPHPSLAFDRPGVVALYNSGPNSNGSAFFITMVASQDFSPNYPIFGQVIQGMEVVQALTPRNPVTGEVLPDGDKISSIVITEH